MGKRLFCVGLILVLQVTLLFWGAPAQALTEEQRLFNEAWRTVSQAYVDETFNNQNWWLIRQKALKQSLDDRDTTYTAIQKMLATLDDPFTRFLKPAQYRSLQTSTTGELTGVGLQIALNPQSGRLEVIAAIADSPAAQAGIQPRDQILQIDQVSTQDLSLDEAAERMRGPIGSRVKLTLLRPNSTSADHPLEVQLSRDRIALNPVETKQLTQANGDVIGYVRLNQFNANATSEMFQAITQLESQNVDRYILDLRSNPGGLLQAGLEIARLWLDPSTIVYTVDRRGVVGNFTTNSQPLTHDPLVVLINHGSASASEILAGALQDNKRAQLVGETTFGKGSIQSLFGLTDGSGLAVTIAKYETPSHRDINKVGIEPDLTVASVPLARDQVATDADPQFQAAVKLLTAPSVLAGAV